MSKLARYQVRVAKPRLYSYLRNFRFFIKTHVRVERRADIRSTIGVRGPQYLGHELGQVYGARCSRIKALAAATRLERASVRVLEHRQHHFGGGNDLRVGMKSFVG